MVYPLWYLVGLTAFWALVPPLVCVAADRIRSGKHGTATRHYQWFWAYVFLAVALAWSTLFLFYPLAHAALQSFTDFSLRSATATKWVGLKNYGAILSDRHWWHSLGVTTIYIGGTLPASILLSLFLAIQVLKQPAPLQTFFKAALYLPGVISPVVSAAIFRWVFYSGDGFANALLGGLGLPRQNWFGDPHLALPVLIVMAWLSANGIGVIVYAAAIGNIPATYYEVARIDGASAWRTFTAVTWPLVQPTTIFVTVTGLIAGFQVFAPALLITGGGPLNTTYFVNYSIYRTFYYDNAFGMATAMSILLMVIIVLVSIANYRWLRIDVEY